MRATATNATHLRFLNQEPKLTVAGRRLQQPVAGLADQRLEIFDRPRVGRNHPEQKENGFSNPFILKNTDRNVRAPVF